MLLHVVDGENVLELIVECLGVLFVRQLLRQAILHVIHQGLVVSWSWEFFKQALPIEQQLGTPLPKESR